MITRERFCLLYDLLNAILSPSKFVYFNENLHCCNRHCHELLVPAKCVKKPVVITLFMASCYPLNNSTVTSYVKYT